MNVPGLLGFISMPGTTELIVIGVVALLIFGKRLPEVARSLGKGIVEFKKGIADVEAEVDRATSDYTPDTAGDTTSTESGYENQDSEYVDTEEDVGAEDLEGTGEADEYASAEEGAEPQDPVDDSDTYEPYDSGDEASEADEAVETDEAAEPDEPAESMDEAASEDAIDDDLDRARRDDAYPTD
jgi:sec-independent protein translocase protein TatA